MNEKNIAIDNDIRLEQAAHYEVSKGLTKQYTLQDLGNKFIEFKKLVMRGSFTVIELEDSVFSRWGIMEKSEKAVFFDNVKELTKLMKNKVGQNKANKSNESNEEKKYE